MRVSTKFLVCLAWLLPSLLFRPQEAHADPTWTLVWNDEFNGANGSLPDSTRWTYDLGGGGWGNGELETYTSATANVYQDGLGHLVIQAVDSSGSFTSARIKSQGLFDQAYGMVEASIQIPWGVGIWPAFWMLGSNINSVSWPACGEIDMMENIGQYNLANVIGGHIHGPECGGCGDYYGGTGVGTTYTLSSGDFNTGFHVFAAQWSPTQISFLVDGNIYQTIPLSQVTGYGWDWVFNHPFFILLNLAVGGTAGTPSASSFPAQMLVDYVRVYKLTDNGTTPYGGTAVSLPGTFQAAAYDVYNDAMDPTEPGEGYAYNGLNSSQTNGVTRTPEAVSTEDCSDPSPLNGGFDCDYTSPGQWLQYTVNVAQSSAAYTFDARVASLGQGGTFHLDVDGTTVTAELSCPNTGGWQNYHDVTAGPITLSAGPHVLLLVEDSMGAGNLGVCNFNYFSLSLPPTPSPTVTVTASQTATFTVSPTASPSPTITLSPTISPTFTISATYSVSPTQTPSFTASPSATVSPTCTVTPSASPSTGNGGNAILESWPVPNPNPQSLAVLLQGPADTVTVRVYTQAMDRIGDYSGGPAQAGWFRVPLTGILTNHVAKGVYFYRAQATQSGVLSKAVVGKLLFLN